MKRLAVMLVALVGALLFAAPAMAAPSLVLRPLHGRAPVELHPDGNGYSGQLVLENTGKKKIAVSNVTMREGSPGNPRLPRGVTATFADGTSEAVLLPGAKKHVEVRWVVPEPIHMRQLWGEVLVQAAGASTPAATAGVRAALPSAMPWLLGHACTWLILIPLIGIVALFAAHLAGYRKLRNLRWVGIVASGVQLALALGLLVHFDPTVCRLDGTSGYQLVQQSRLLPGLGVQYAVGIDGISIGLLVMVPLLALAASLMSYAESRRLTSYWALVLLLDAGLTGVFASIDLMLLFAFLVVTLVAAVLLIAGWSGGRRAALPAAVYVGAAALLFLFVVMFVSGHAGTNYLFDGSRAPHTFSLIELSHVDFVAMGLSIAGMNAVKVLEGALFLASVILLAAPPLHAWLPRALGRAPAGVAILLAGAMMPLGAYLLLRVGYTALPQGAVWAAGTVAGFGAAGVIYGGLAALAQPDLRGFAAYASVSQMSLCLLGLGSLTVVGVQGVVMQMLGHALVAALLFGSIGAVGGRLHETRIDRLAGLARERPELGLLLGLALLASLGLPGTTGFVAELLTLAGATPMARVAVLFAAVGLVIAAAAHVRVFGRVLFGRFPERFQRGPYLEPHGGRLPTLEQRETTALVPLAVLVVLLGIAPGMLLFKTRGSCLDHADLVNPVSPTQVVENTPPSRLRLAALEPQSPRHHRGPPPAPRPILRQTAGNAAQPDTGWWWTPGKHDC